MTLDPVPGVYCIRHKGSGKAYIGSSSDALRRVKGHAAKLKKDRHENRELQRHWNADGDDAFEAELIRVAFDATERYEIEKRLISSCDPAMLYNKAHKVPLPRMTPICQPEESGLISISRTAKLLRVTRQTIYNWLKTGKAPKHTRIGEHYFFYLSDVEARLRGGK